MTYQEAEAYILSIPKFTKKNKPEHTKLFLQYLGNPEKQFQTIHVAGTNGKGSVCAYLDAMLRAQGKTVGLFTSPHLVTMNERIVMNGERISEKEFLEIFELAQNAVGRMAEDNLPHPTFFEYLFGMAICAFAREHVEYAILETGLGGRLDATNSIANPVCSVITSIGMDHVEFLGDTLEKIAGEKAGIIKQGVPVFYAEGQKESNEVIEAKAKECNASCKMVGKDAFEIVAIEEKDIAFSCLNAYYEDVTWKLHNTAVYQPENACLALEVMRMLFGDKKQLIRWQEALSKVTWEGRMEEILPNIYIDGAHNISAIERFTESVLKQDEREKKRKIILFSAVQDKDYEQMIAHLCRHVDADMYIVTQITNQRAEDVTRLGNIFRKYTDRKVVEKVELSDAWNYLLKHQEGRRVYCLGSLYLVGMIKDLIQHV